jgi:HlyD family secretion protein
VFNQTESSETKTLRLVADQELLSPVNRWTSHSGTVLAGAVGLTLLLAAVLHYDVTIQAAAVARPAGDLSLVQSERSGSIKQILVKQNQWVQHGTPIAYLDTTQLHIKQRQLQVQIQQDGAQYRQLQSQLRALDSQLKAETTAQNQLNAQAKTELSFKKREHRDHQIATQSSSQAADAALTFARKELNRYRKLARYGAVSQSQYQQKQADYSAAVAKQKQTQAALNPSQASVTIAQQQIVKQQAKSNATLADLNRQRSILVQQQAKMQSQLSQTHKELEAIQTDLNNSILRATGNGLILQLNLRNPGQVVQSGTTVAQIVPAQSAVVFKAMVATQDLNQIQVGQSVHLRVDACPYPDFGLLNGVVREVAPDAIPMSSPQGRSIDAAASMSAEITPNHTSVVEAIIHPRKGMLTNGARQCEIQAGMTARADIIADRESMMQFILRKARLITDL